MPLDNFGVVDRTAAGAILARSAQPDIEALNAVRALGITVIVKLNSERESPAALESAAGFDVRPHYASQFEPSPEWCHAMATLLQSYLDAGTSVLVHCTHGRDRTGLAWAAYRVLVNRWSAEGALAEFRAYGAGEPIVALVDSGIRDVILIIAKEPV